MKIKRVLVVDDEPSITRTMKVNLELGGAYSVCTVNQAHEALAAARAFHPDIMFLDVMMPEMDGGDLAAELKADPDLWAVPIVFLTAIVTQQEVRASGAKIGGHLFLAKPLNLEALAACIEEQTQPHA